MVVFQHKGPGVKIRINPHDSGFAKRPKVNITTLKLPDLAGSGVKLWFNPKSSFSLPHVVLSYSIHLDLE